MLRSVKQELQSGPRDQSLRRAFNTVLRGGQTLDATINAISTLKPSLKSRFDVTMKDFDVFYPTEPRMVYTLGIMYYLMMASANDDEMDDNLGWILTYLNALADKTDNAGNGKTIEPYKYFDFLEKHKLKDGQTTFYRNWFDGSMRTMGQLMEFLGGSELETMQLKKTDFGGGSCKTYANIDLDKVDVELNNSDPIVYYDGKKAVKVKVLGKGGFGEVVLYKAGSVHVALKTYKNKNDREIEILQNLDGFETCNVIGVRLIETDEEYFCAMVPASGSLQDLAPAKSEKVAKKVIYDVAKMYQCMIRQRNLFYYDIKSANTLFTCDSSTGSIRIFAGDIGGFCEQGKQCPSTYRAPLPFDNILVYDMEKQMVKAYPIHDNPVQYTKLQVSTVLTGKILRNLDTGNFHKFDAQDMAKDVQENELFLKIENVYKQGEYVLLRFEDGPTMMEKYLKLVKADKATVIKLKTKYFKKKPAKKPGKKPVKQPANKPCSKLRKTKDPKCEEQEGCQWVTGKGCTEKAAKKSSSKPAAKPAAKPVKKPAKKKPCSKLRKTKDPKCEEQEGCKWVVRKGCTEK